MENSNGAIGFVGLLTIVFIVLKLTGVINWAWLWVLAPIWGSVILACLLLIFLAIATVVVDILARR